VTARYAEAVTDALSAFLQDATSGIAARCAAVNADLTGVDLPVTWNFASQRRGQPLKLPLCRIVFLASDYARERRPGYQPRVYECLIALGVGIETTRADPATEQLVLQRLERVLMECLEEETTWQGHTLGGRVAYSDPGRFSGGTTTLPSMSGARAVVAALPIRITHAERRAKT
jgi:hypothetical protein